MWVSKQASSTALRAGAAAVCLALAACGDSATESPAAPEIRLERIEVVHFACADPCGVRLTYQARRVDTLEPVAVSLRLSGDGWYPPRVATTLPEGQVSFNWEYPRVDGATYRLSVCPESGDCSASSATVHLP